MNPAYIVKIPARSYGKTLFQSFLHLPIKDRIIETTKAYACYELLLSIRNNDFQILGFYHGCVREFLVMMRLEQEIFDFQSELVINYFTYGEFKIIYRILENKKGIVEPLMFEVKYKCEINTNDNLTQRLDKKLKLFYEALNQINI